MKKPTSLAAEIFLLCVNLCEYHVPLTIQYNKTHGRSFDLYGTQLTASICQTKVKHKYFSEINGCNTLKKIGRHHAE